MCPRPTVLVNAADRRARLATPKPWRMSHLRDHESGASGTRHDVCYPILLPNFPRGHFGPNPGVSKTTGMLVLREVELARLELATSWVRSRSCFRTNCADLLGVYRLSTRWSVQISGAVCRGLSGVWSAQTRARTSGDVPIMAASPLLGAPTLRGGEH